MGKQITYPPIATKCAKRIGPISPKENTKGRQSFDCLPFLCVLGPLDQYLAANEGILNPLSRILIKLIKPIAPIKPTIFVKFTSLEDLEEGLGVIGEIGGGVK